MYCIIILHKKAQNIHANVQFFQKWKHSKNMNLIKTHNQYLFTWYCIYYMSNFKLTHLGKITHLQ